MRVLIAEDERITRRSLERRLVEWGHDVACASDGTEAWSMFEARPFDAVLSDWEMPGLDGIELVRRIRRASVHRYCYIVLLSSKSETTDLIAGLEAGADDFLRKPCDPGELRARLNTGRRIIDLERQLADANESMRRDLTAAADYVRSLLPAPISNPLRIDWRYVPAGDLAGDSLGYHWIDADHLALYVLDVTGHGLDAALLSVTILNVLKSMSLPKVDFREPEQVLACLNERFPMEAHQDRCFTAWYGVYNRATRELSWSGGGHPPALLLPASSGDTIVQLPSCGPLLGMLPSWDGPTSRRAISPGETLSVFSDGVYEIVLPDRGLWTYEELVETIQRVRTSGAPILDGVAAAVRELREGQPLEDDYTFLQAEF